MAIEIVDLPSKNGDFHSYVMLVYQRVVSQFLCHVRLPKSKAYPPSDIDPSCIMS